jgi:outer membrane lipoprotein-sorting protein
MRIICVVTVILLISLPNLHGEQKSGSNLLQRSVLFYIRMQAYSDTAEMTTEFGTPGTTPVVEHYSFKTYFRAPQQFFFEFTKSTGERFVIWSEGGDFQTWSTATHTQDNYPQSQVTLAFSVASIPTKGASLQIAPLLFAKSGLKGPLLNLVDVKMIGTETVAGHSCQKFFAEKRLTGLGEEERPTTVWVDSGNLLIRKILEDTPKGMGTGGVNRVTTVFEPKIDGAFTDSAFHFVPP